ncbi:MAG: FeoB-associated Cys-rich membrane protein [Planctomycetes bacterium]|nr:FeoB-associated Cys-rich membrane protein [Planctomycetota bacterium]
MPEWAEILIVTLLCLGALAYVVRRLKPKKSGCGDGACKGCG